MNIELKQLSKTYRVSKLEDKDIQTVFLLCRENPQFYRYCPPFVSVNEIKKDMQALPTGKSLEDKYYLGFWDENQLVAVMDLILEYPDEKTAFIGFFMMNAQLQGRGIGSKIIEEACTYLKEKFSYIRLGYVKGNRQSEGFWIKNKFHATGVITRTADYEIVMMQRRLWDM